MDSWEQCDDWNLIDWDGCDNSCDVEVTHLKIYWWPEGDVDWNLSPTKVIMRWEYLPVWWNVQASSNFQNYCSGLQDFGKFNKETLRLNFKIEWWGKIVWHNNIKWFDTSPLCAFVDGEVDWKMHVPTNILDNLDLGESKITSYVANIDKCVYNTGLWVYRWESDSSFVDEIANTRFTISDSYMIQRWATMTKKTDTSIWFFEHYYDLAPKFVTYYVNKKTKKFENYVKTDLQYVLSWFVEKYKKIVVPLSDLWQEFQGAQYASSPYSQYIYKLPIKNFYYIDLNALSITWFGINWLDIKNPTVLIVDNWDVNINWDIKWPFMLVVRSWSINIWKWNCDKIMSLDWVYVTDQKFIAEKIRNDDPLYCTWCRDGRLVVKWVMIWNTGIVEWDSNITNNRRSVLFGWFTDWPSAAVSRWASLTIDANVNIWLNPTQWVKDLFDKLQIKKMRTK